MLARIAQELFWLGRDLTRAEHTARMLDGAFHADVAGAPGERGVALSWEGVLAIIGAKPPAPGERATESAPASAFGRAEVARLLTLDTASPASVVSCVARARRRGRPPESARPSPCGRAEVARLLTLATASPASVVSCVARARERGRTLRDVISTEMWEALNSFYLSLERYDLQAALVTGPYSVYQEVKERCALFWGLVERTMLRDEGRSFLEAGGRIEEADMVLRMLRVAIPTATPANDSGREGEALAVLHAIGGLQAYRRAVRFSPTLDLVARFLLYDSAYPGSIAFAVEALRSALLTADAPAQSSPPVLRLGRPVSRLELEW